MTIDTMGVPSAAGPFEIAGLRSLPPESRAATEIEAARGLLALVCAEPGSAVALEYAADSATGYLRCVIAAEGADPCTAAELEEALSACLLPVMELGRLPAGLPAGGPQVLSLGRQVRWLQPGTAPVAPMGRSGPPLRVHALATHGWEPARFEEIAAALVRHPGTQLSLRISASPLGDSRTMPAVAVTAHVTLPGGRLPAGLRAVLDRWAPGYPFARTPAPAGDPLILHVADAEKLAFVPTAGPVPIPGFRAAGPAPLPVRPLSAPARAGSLQAGSATLASGQYVPVLLGGEERRQHVHITGKTGTGKSTLLAALAQQAAASGEGMLLIDPHGDLARRVAVELPENAAARTWTIDAGDLDHPIPVNTLAVSDPDTFELAIADLAEAFYSIYDPGRTGIVGPRFEQVLGMCLRTLSALHGPRASFLDVPRLLTDIRFRRQALAAVSDPRVRAWWANDHTARSSHEYADVIAWVSSKWERFIGTRALRGALCSGLDAFDPADAMDQGQIILLDLSKGKLGDQASRLLGFLYLTRFWEAATRREHIDRTFTVIVDEAQSFLAGSLPAMLSEGRKFGLSVLMANQYHGQLSPALADALSGNVATTFAFRSGERDTEPLRARMGQALAPTMFTTLPDLSAICQRTAGPVSPDPHIVRITHNEGPVPTGRVDRALLYERTVASLSTPHAAAIRQSLETGAALPVEPAHSPARPPRPATPRRTPPKHGMNEENVPIPSFLDEWLAKHPTSTSKNTGQSQDTA
jgi:hypothetical protein